MRIGDQVGGGIYAGKIIGHHIICSPNEYDLPFRVNWYQAIDYCKALGMELPTKAELNLLYKLYKRALAHFPKREYQWYWTSTESSSEFAWGQYFYTSFQDPSSKSFHLYVRPIKRIKI